MDTRSGEIKDISEILLEDKKHFIPIPKKEFEKVKSMSMIQRIEWARHRQKVKARNRKRRIMK